MQITSGIESVKKALSFTTKTFSGNIIFRKCVPLNAKATRWTVTLRCKSSKAPGHRRYFGLGGSSRVSVNACWHAHGIFFDNLIKLDPQAVIRTNGRKIDTNGGNWIDRQIGSLAKPLYFSESCDCEHGVR